MKLAVIVGATREVRKTLQQAKWVAKTAEAMDDVSVELVDLVDYPLPFFDEAISPRYNPGREPAPAVQKWLSKLTEFDAFVFVTPEYNHNITGVLKNAIDYIDYQLVHKPGFVVSHGSAGGARAQMILKESLSESKLVIIPTGPALAMVSMSEYIDEEGVMNAEAAANPYGAQPAIEDALKDLKWFSDAIVAASK